MNNDIRKPANWENRTFHDLLDTQAGRAYVCTQKGERVDVEISFASTRQHAHAGSYDVYADGSLWFRNNSQDEVWADVVDFVTELEFSGLWWDDSDDRDGLLVDAMDRGLLTHLWGEHDAREFFKAAGGNVPEVAVQA